MMLTDWAHPMGGLRRRVETCWLKPVRPGDTIQPFGTIEAKQATAKFRWWKTRAGRSLRRGRPWSSSRPARSRFEAEIR
jgi:acyl dehydratase